MCQEANGLKQAVWEKLVDNLSEVAELKGELKTSLKSLNERIDRLLALEERVGKNTLEITRIKTVWTVVAGFVALLVSFAKQLFFAHGR